MGVSVKRGQIMTKGGKLPEVSLYPQSFPIHTDKKHEQARVLISVSSPKIM
jgi:hypothetical protein